MKKIGCFHLFILALVLPGIASQNVQKTEQIVVDLRQAVVGRTLTGKWKLAHDDNFKINTKNEMINIQSDKRKRSRSVQNFFKPTITVRQVDAFFEAPDGESQATSFYL